MRAARRVRPQQPRVLRRGPHVQPGGDRPGEGGQIHIFEHAFVRRAGPAAAGRQPEDGRAHAAGIRAGGAPDGGILHRGGLGAAAQGGGRAAGEPGGARRARHPARGRGAGGHARALRRAGRAVVRLPGRARAGRPAGADGGRARRGGAVCQKRDAGPLPGRAARRVRRGHARPQRPGALALAAHARISRRVRRRVLFEPQRLFPRRKRSGAAGVAIAAEGRAPAVPGGQPVRRRAGAGQRGRAGRRGPGARRDDGARRRKAGRRAAHDAARGRARTRAGGGAKLPRAGVRVGRGAPHGGKAPEDYTPDEWAIAHSLFGESAPDAAALAAVGNFGEVRTCFDRFAAEKDATLAAKADSFAAVAQAEARGLVDELCRRGARAARRWTPRRADGRARRAVGGRRAAHPRAERGAVQRISRAL